MLGHKRIPSREGGVEIVVEELATRLVNKGYEVDVYNRKGNNVSDKNIKTKKIKKYKGVFYIRNLLKVKHTYVSQEDFDF